MNLRNFIMMKRTLRMYSKNNTPNLLEYLKSLTNEAGIISVDGNNIHFGGPLKMYADPQRSFSFAIYDDIYNAVVNRELRDVSIEEFCLRDADDFIDIFNPASRTLE